MAEELEPKLYTLKWDRGGMISTNYTLKKIKEVIDGEFPPKVGDRVKAFWLANAKGRVYTATVTECYSAVKCFDSGFNPPSETETSTTNSSDNIPPTRPLTPPIGCAIPDLDAFSSGLVNAIEGTVHFY